MAPGIWRSFSLSGSRVGVITSKAMHRDWLSVKMVADLPEPKLSIQSAAMCMAWSSSSYEHVSRAPFCLRVAIMLGRSGSSVVITAAAPPSDVPALAEPSV